VVAAVCDSSSALLRLYSFVVVKSYLPELRLRYNSHTLIISSVRAVVDRVFWLEQIPLSRY
jgi:hypothetical protein